MLIMNELSIRKCSSADNHFDENDASGSYRLDKDLYLLSDINEESIDESIRDSMSSQDTNQGGHKPSINEDDPSHNTLLEFL